MKLKMITVTVGCILLAALTAGCSAKKKQPDSLARIEKEQVLYAAVLADNSPFSAVNSQTQEASGKEVELVKAIAERMGVTVQFTGVDQAGLESSLQSGEAQIAVGQIVESDGLKNRVAASLSYGSGRIYVVTPRGNFSSTLGAFSNGAVGASGHLSETANIQINGISGVTIVNYEDTKTVENDLLQKKILGYFCYESQAEELMKSEFLQAQSVNGIQAENHVMIMKKGDSRLQAQIDTILSQMIENDEISAIWNP